MLSKLSYLNSYITLTLGYLNPALNNSALEVRLTSCSTYLAHLAHILTRIDSDVAIPCFMDWRRLM